MTFSEMFAEVNGLHHKGFQRWLFADGMAYLAARQWWGRREMRVNPHEGIDFCLYETNGGGQGELLAGALVPAAQDGEVVRIHDDFLGKTVWLKHGEPDVTGKILHTVYGHIAPNRTLAVGDQVVAGEIIGVVAEPSLAGKKIAPHLHLTAIKIIASLDGNSLHWSLVHDPARAELLSPLFL